MRLLTYAAFALAAAFLGSCSTMPNVRSDNDPYLWLEEVEGERALAWVREQNAQSLAQLEGDPRFAALRADALAIATSQDRLALGAVRDGYLYNFWQDETHVRGIWRRSPLADYAANAPRWETLLDIDALARAENANWVFKGVDCLEGSTRCMVSLSDGGKDATTWREYDIEARAFVEGGFALPDAKSQIAWADADTLLVATDWGPENDAPSMTESGYPFIVKRLRRGQALSAATEFMRGARTDVGVFAGILQDVDGRRLPVVTQAITFFESASFLLPEDGAPQRLTLPPKASVQGLFHGQLLVTLQQDWSPQGAIGGAAQFPNGALISIALDTATGPSPRVTLLTAPGPRDSIEAVAVTRDAVLVAGYSNVRGRILRFAPEHGAWTQTQIALPPNGSVSFAGASPTDSQAFAVFEDFLTPSTLYALDDGATIPRPVRALPAQFDASRFVVEQFEATSRDGTQVPYFVVRPHDMALDGRNPTLLYAYGGFQVSELPSYIANTGKLWLERGGVYVLANIRGGGEFGPAWHQAGLTTNRQRIFDDFYAVEQDLVNRNITGPRRLGIMGGSNGGLLMGVMLNQHPEMVNAAVVQVPLLDMLRYDQLLAGASWVGEYGSPSNPTERAFLETISPYQNLRARADFPTPFVLTSTKDDRVHPGHARKYVARLRELGLPALYYENIDGGHSAAANLNETARRLALEYTYLTQQLMD
ncbi:MAG: prolyl oligopeptidase family serine peptidase [Hyphomonadaceae bacterium]|nr:prolyl oligopeptidase family serine peptidase [Hyphomonadaceae bacterium]